MAVIPARYGSTRFPGKPLASLNGAPMVQHVIDRCRQIDPVERVILATDDERIARAVRDAEVVMTSAEHASGTDRVAEVVQSLDTEFVVNVQGDEPLFEPAELSRVVADFMDSGAPIATLRAPLARRELDDANVVKVVVATNGRALYFSRAAIPFVRGGVRTQASVGDSSETPLSGPFWKHVGVYLYRRAALLRWARMTPSPLEQVESLEQLRILEAGEEIRTFEIREAAPGVDTPEDLERVRALLEGSESR